MVVVVQSGVLEEHVHLAIRLLTKLKASNRPASAEKLSDVLQRRGCCQFRYLLPLSTLVQAMVPHIEESNADPEVRALVVELAKAAAIAPEQENGGGKVRELHERMASLNKQLVKVSEELDKTKAGKEEFFQRKSELQAEIDAAATEQDHLLQKIKSAHTGDDEAKQLKSEISDLLQKMGHSSEAEIDARIAYVEDALSHETLSLKEEKARLAEIADLKKMKLTALPELMHLKQKLSAFASSNDSQEKTEYRELRAKKKTLLAKMRELNSTRAAETADFQKHFEKQKALSRRIQGLNSKIDRLPQELVADGSNTAGPRCSAAAGILEPLMAQWTATIAQSVTSQLLRCPASSFVGKPQRVFAQWLSTKSILSVKTDVQTLLKELQNCGFLSVSSDGRPEYNEEALQQFTVLGVSAHALPNARAWISQLRVGTCYVRCVSAPIITLEDIKSLRALLNCGLDVNIDSGFARIDILESTVLPQELLKDVISLVVGSDPAFVSKGKFLADAGSHVVGKCGHHLKHLEVRHKVKLSLEVDGDEGCIVGWLATSRLLAMGGSDVWTDAEKSKIALAELRNSAEKLAEKVSNDAVLHGVPLLGVAVSVFSLPCIQSPVLENDIQALRSLLGCGLKLGAGFMKVMMLKDTKVPQAEVENILSASIGKLPAFTVKRTYSADSAGNVIGGKGDHIKMIEGAHGVRLSVKEIAETKEVGEKEFRIMGWLCPRAISGKLSLIKEGYASTCVPVLIKDVSAKLCEAVTHDVTVKLDEIQAAKNKVRLSMQTSNGRDPRPQLRRAFSTEYSVVKNLRDEDRTRALAKRQQRKEHLCTKDARLLTKRGRRKDHDKGPAMHGGRHKEDHASMNVKGGMIDEDMLPPSGDDDADDDLNIAR